MGSGVIYAVIVGLWALVLIPLWLRNHDRTGEVRAVDKYRTAMTSLSAADSRKPESGSTARPARSTTSRDDSVRLTQDHEYDDDHWSLEPSPAEVAAARRRMVMGVLVVLVVGAVVLAALDVLPWWFLVLPVGLLAGFAMVSRAQAARASEQARREQRATRPAARTDAALDSRDSRDSRDGRDSRDSRDRREASRSAAPAARQSRHTAQPAPQELPDELPEVRRASRDLPAAVGEGWSAVEAPLPTYVSAPRASRVPRVIDLTHTGAWSGEAMVEEARRMRATDTFAKEMHGGPDLYDQSRDEVRRETHREIHAEIERVLNVDDDAFFDQLAAETKGRRTYSGDAGDLFDQDAPRAAGDY